MTFQSTRICNVCGDRFQTTPNRLKKRGNVCLPCVNKAAAEWRVRRKAEGRPVISTKMSLDYHRAYNAEYCQKQAVKEKKRESARKNLQKYPEKHKARWLARRAIRSGVLVRRPCEICGEGRVDAHHDDYSQPLGVRWLCRFHHAQHHKTIARGEHE